MLPLTKRLLATLIGAALFVTAPGLPFYQALAADIVGKTPTTITAGGVTPVVVPGLDGPPNGGVRGNIGVSNNLSGRGLRFKAAGAQGQSADLGSIGAESIAVGSLASETKDGYGPTPSAASAAATSPIGEDPIAGADFSAPGQGERRAWNAASEAKQEATVSRVERLKKVFTTPLSAGAVAATLGRKVAAPVTSVRRMMRGDDEIRPFVMKYKKDFRKAQALLVADAVLSTAIAWGLGRLLDAAVGTADMPKTVTLMVAFSAFSLFASVSYSLIERAHAWVKAAVGTRVVRDLRIHLFAHLAAQDAAFFKANKSQELAPRISEDVAKLSTTNVDIPAGMPYSLVSLAASSAMLFSVDWRLALLVLGAMPMFGILAAKFGAKFEKLSEIFADKRAKMVGEAGDSLSNMEVVKVFGAEDAVSGRFARTASDLAESRLVMDQAYSWYWALSSSWGDMATKFFIIVLGAWMLFYYGFPSAGAIMAMQGYAYGVKGAFQSLSNSWTSHKDAEGASKRVRELLARKTAIADAPGAAELGPIDGTIEFKDVDFAYEDGTPVLKGVSFKVQPGQVAAFVGETGSGKSTILRMVSRLYDPVSGAVSVDGQDLRGVQLKSLTRQMAVVPQDSALFNGSIRENLVAVQPGASEEQMRAALKAAHGEFVFDKTICPEGLDTDVGERGAKLSGGQKQRIAIARAILRNPRLLLLDEATSALDNQSEALVQDALKALMKGRTTFVVAHRLTTIQNADIIFVLDAGRIVESGTHWQLIAKQGRYHKLWNASQAPGETKP